MRLRPTLVFLGILTLLPGASAYADPSAGETVTDPSAPSIAIPLVTGDQVLALPDGRFEVAPAPGREDVGFSSPSAPGDSGDVLIVPDDALEAVGTGAVDDRLFNVAELAEHGVAETGTLPLIVDGEPVALSAAETAEYWAANDLASGETTVRLDAPEAGLDAAATAQPVRVVFENPHRDVPNVLQVNMQNQETGKVYYLRSAGGNVAAGEAPPGRYTALAFQKVNPSGDETAGMMSLTYHEITIGEAAAEWTVATDDLREIRFQVDRRDAVMHSVEFKIQANLGELAYGMSFTTIQTGQWHVYSTPTGERNVDFSIRPTLTAPADADGDTAYSYHLVFVGDDGVPDSLTFRVRDSKLSRQTVEYASRGPAHSMLRNSYGSVDTAHNSAFIVPELPVSVPSTRTEYYTADPRVSWTHQGRFGDAVTPDWHVRYDGVYSPGRRSVLWGGAPLGPGLVAGELAYSIGRTGDRIQGITPVFSGPDAAEISWSRTGVTGVSVLSKDGVAIAKNTTRPEVQNFVVPSGSAGEYALTVDVTRSAPWSDLGVAASAEWTFHSEPTDSKQLLDLMTVRMDATGLDDGYASRRLPQLVTLDVQRQGADRGTAGLAMEVSYDDGATWKKVPLLFVHGDKGFAVLTHPAGAEYVSTRLHAEDDAGYTFTATTIRSYGLE